MLSGERFHVSSLRSGTTQGCTITTFIKLIYINFSQSKRQEEEIKGTQFQKDEIKLSILEMA